MESVGKNKKWYGMEYILSVELRRFADNLVVKYDREEQRMTEIFGQATKKTESP